MTLQINHNISVSDETYRKFVVNTFPEDETFYIREGLVGHTGELTLTFFLSLGSIEEQFKVRSRLNLVTL